MRRVSDSWIFSLMAVIFAALLLQSSIGWTAA
jgi:hypothetical protein